MSGFDLSDVRVFRGSRFPATLRAHAVARRGEIDLAPGQERHLAHEAWHIVQQRQQRVRATGAVGKTAINGSKSLEREADRRGAEAMRGAPEPARAESSAESSAASSAASSGASSSAAPHAASADASSPAQLQSHFNPDPPVSDVDTEIPLKTLHNNFGTYFSKAKPKVAERYIFQFTQPVGIKPDEPEFQQTFDRARTAKAVIDASSQGKATQRLPIIGLYGSLGSMERSIFGRQNVGKLYDGGHLIERSLMEGDDADIGGNLAPQEGVPFNQSLMRGWEKLPETLQHKITSFNYKVRLNYSSNTYQRTGKNLADAGIFPPALLTNLPATGTDSLDELEKKNVTFQRWIPYLWEGKVTRPGNTIPVMLFTKGDHVGALQPTEATAESTVVSNVDQTGMPGLKRMHSGEISGFFETAKDRGGKLEMGNQESIFSKMYQPEPQDAAEQPTGTRKRKAGGALPKSTTTVKKLKVDVDVPKMFDDLDKVQTKHKTGTKNIKYTTVDAAAKKASPAYRDGIRPYLNATQSRDFVAKVQALKAQGTLPTQLAQWSDFIESLNLTVIANNNLVLLDTDPRLKGLT